MKTVELFENTFMEEKVTTPCQELFKTHINSAIKKVMIHIKTDTERSKNKKEFSVIC